MNPFQKILGWWKTRTLTRKLLEAAIISEALFQSKGNTVVCEYCGQLLPKEESFHVYDADESSSAFYHAECLKNVLPEEVVTAAIEERIKQN
jgi:hypothetical protein